MLIGKEGKSVFIAKRVFEVLSLHNENNEVKTTIKGELFVKPHQHPFKRQLHTTHVGAGGWEPHVAG